MSQRVFVTVHVLLLVAGIGLFVSGPIGRETAPAAVVEATVAGGLGSDSGGGVEVFRAAGALLMGVGLLGISRRPKVIE